MVYQAIDGARYFVGSHDCIVAEWQYSRRLTASNDLKYQGMQIGAQLFIDWLAELTLKRRDCGVGTRSGGGRSKVGCRELGDVSGTCPHMEFWQDISVSGT